ncbi:hypothetical protein JCM9279_006345 [Rhodotorula babjevae]
MSLANEPDQAHLQELERKFQRVSQEIAKRRAEPAEQRRGMTLGDILNECVANKEKVADEFLEAALPLQLYEHFDGKKVNQVDIVKMLCGAMPALMNNAFRTALNKLVPFVSEWDKLDGKEADFRKQHKFDQLELIHKQLTAELIEGHGPAAALSVHAEEIEGLYAGTSGERTFRHTVRAVIDGAATAEKQEGRLRKAYKAEADGSPQRRHLKKTWRLAQGLEALYLCSEMAKPYAVLRERIRPYRRFLLSQHKELLSQSRVKMVRAMGGSDSSTSVPAIDNQEQHSVGHLSLRQREIYFGRRSRYGRW